jgi:beta-hydroxylase
VTDRPDVAFKILSRADWRAALAEGRYDGSAVDRADGYIHLSAADQLEATAAKHYAGQAELMLVEVDLTALGDALIWEPSRGGALFPHIYGPLPVAATRGARALSVTDAGDMILSELP